MSKKDYDYEPFTSHGVANLLHAGIDTIQSLSTEAVNYLENHVSDFKTTDDTSALGSPHSSSSSSSSSSNSYTPLPPPRTKENLSTRQYTLKRDAARKNNLNKKNNNINISIDNNNSDNNNSDNTMSRRISTGEHNGDEELPVVQPPARIAAIIPDYTTIKLRWSGDHVFSWDTATGFINTYFALNNLNNPGGFNSTYDYLGSSQWKTLFQYYRILENNIRCEFVNVSQTTDGVGTDINTTQQYYDRLKNVNVYFQFADTTTPNYNTVRELEEGKHVQKVTVLSPAHGHGTFGVLKYNYSPKQFMLTNGTVSETSTAERWTPVSSSPTDLHYIHVTCVQHNAGVSLTSNNFTVHMKFNAECVVQFRETESSILNTSQTS